MKKLQVEESGLEGVMVITPPTVFKDFRGRYVETYNEELYRQAGIEVKFVQDDYSFSSRHVLRGIHADDRTWKLVSCLYGSFYLVIVDCDRRSAGFGRWVSFNLSGAEPRQVLAPPGHGVAHLITSEHAIFNYKQSTYYDRSAQTTYRWDDPRFNISWPVKEPILSLRDQQARD